MIRGKNSITGFYFILSLLLLNCHSTDAYFTVEVEFISYINPTLASIQYDGRCCDNPSLHPPNCTNNCDTYFFLCLRNSSTPLWLDRSLANESCPYGWIVTEEIARGSRANDKQFSLGSLEESGKTPNPVVFESSLLWPGNVQLAIVVIDRDGSSRDENDDLVDIIGVDVSDNNLPTEGLPISSLVYTYIGFYSWIELSYRVNCSNNFYGSDCGTLCIARNDSLGHYTCNETTGMIICNEGYKNTSTWCTQCVPQVGCSPTGGFCEYPGDCICKDGFHGENCTEIMLFTDQNESGGSLAPVIGGTITGLVFVAAIGTVVIIAIVAEIRRRQKTDLHNTIYEHLVGLNDTPQQRPKRQPSELFSNAAYVKTRLQHGQINCYNITHQLEVGQQHEEFETSQNPGYRVLSLARQNGCIVSSYPGAQLPHHNEAFPSSNEEGEEEEDFYIYSYPRTSERRIQPKIQQLIGIYSVEEPCPLEEEGEGNKCELKEDENGYTYLKAEYVNGNFHSSNESVNKQGETSVKKKLKPMPLPRTKSASDVSN